MSRLIVILIVSDTFSLFSEAAAMLVTSIKCDDVVPGALTLNYMFDVIT